MTPPEGELPPLDVTPPLALEPPADELPPLDFTPPLAVVPPEPLPAPPFCCDDVPPEPEPPEPPPFPLVLPEPQAHAESNTPVRIALRSPVLCTSTSINAASV
jgi:hypothetical protein